MSGPIHCQRGSAVVAGVFELVSSECFARSVLCSAARLLYRLDPWLQEDVFVAPLIWFVASQRWAESEYLVACPASFLAVDNVAPFAEFVVDATAVVVEPMTAAVVVSVVGVKPAAGGSCSEPVCLARSLSAPSDRTSSSLTIVVSAVGSDAAFCSSDWPHPVY